MQTKNVQIELNDTSKSICKNSLALSSIKDASRHGRYAFLLRVSDVRESSKLRTEVLFLESNKG